MHIELLKDRLLSQYTTLNIGGAADYVAVVKTENELVQALQFASQTAVPVLILGEGSNVLCRDEGYRGVVILNRIKGYTTKRENEETTLVTIGAGENFDQAVEKTIQDNLWGLENLSSIPGTVGATPVQNVGAYGIEVSDLIESVEAINSDSLEEKIFTNEMCQFEYRDSFFKTEAGKKWFVVNVTYRLHNQLKPILHYKDLQTLQTKSSITQTEIRNHVIKVRSEKFPDWRKVGTAGSFFKNPIIKKDLFIQLQSMYEGMIGHETESGDIKISLGWVLDNMCHLKGYKSSKVGLYKNQALVLVTDEGATASDVENFVAEIKKLVAEKTNIKIEREVLTV